MRRLRLSGIKAFKPTADFDWSWPTKIEREVIERALSLSGGAPTSIATNYPDSGYYLWSVPAVTPGSDYTGTALQDLLGRTLASVRSSNGPKARSSPRSIDLQVELEAAA